MNENIQTNQQPVNQAPVQGPTKKCKHCQSDIPKKAKVCPVCRKKQGGKLKWIIIIIIALFIIGSIGGKKSDSGSSKSDTSTSSSAPSTTVETQEPEIEYTAVDVSTMMDALNSNALKAEETYKEQYLEITGRLAVIDSKGKYISVFSKNDDFAIVGVQCYIKDDATKDKVMEMAKDDTVTLKVHITDVGEVLGYQADIIEVE